MNLTFSFRKKIAPKKRTKSQLEVCGAPISTNFERGGIFPSTLHPLRRRMLLEMARRMGLMIGVVKMVFFKF